MKNDKFQHYINTSAPVLSAFNCSKTVSELNSFKTTGPWHQVWQQLQGWLIQLVCQKKLLYHIPSELGQSLKYQN